MEVIVFVVLSVLSNPTALVLVHLLQVNHRTSLLRYGLSLLRRIFTKDRLVLEFTIQLRLFCATI